MRCCVPGCGQKTEKGTSFHKFPSKEPERMKEWVDAISKYLSDHHYEKKCFAPKTSNVVCSKHFTSNSYIPVLDARPVLRTTACPSIFLCDPNAIRRRKPKQCDIKMVGSRLCSSRLCKIAPKPGIDDVEKISDTKPLLPEILDTISNSNEPAATSTVVLSQFPQSTYEWKPDCSSIPIGLDVSVKTEVFDDVSENCANCSILRWENETLRAEINALKESVAALREERERRQASSHSIETGTKESVSHSDVNSSTPTDNTISSDDQASILSSLRKAVALDHRYESTPRTLKRKLLTSETQKEIIAKKARLTAKQLERTQLKVAEMKQVMKTLVQEVEIRPEVVTDIRKIFGRVPLELHKRSSSIHSAGKKKVRKVHTTPKKIQLKPEKRIPIK